MPTKWLKEKHGWLGLVQNKSSATHSIDKEKKERKKSQRKKTFIKQVRYERVVRRQQKQSSPY